MWERSVASDGWKERLDGYRNSFYLDFDIANTIMNVKCSLAIVFYFYHF